MSPSDWQTMKVDDIKAPTKNALAMGPFGSNIKSDFFVPDGVPVVRGNNLNADRFDDNGFVFLTEEKADELSSANAFLDDIVFTHRGTLGQVGIIPKNSKYARYVVSQSQMKLTCDKKKVDPYFIFYFFRSPIGQHRLLQNTSTTGVPAISRPLTSLRNIEISLPPLPEQHTIAHILGTLDDKIELNRKMNATFEAMAQAIFKSWFVDFDPVRAKMEGREPTGMDAETAALFPDGFEISEVGKIPEGWAVTRMEEHVVAVKGLSYKGSGLSDAGMPLHNLNSVYEGGAYKYEGIKFYTGEYRDRHLVSPGDLIVTNTEQGFDFLLIGYPAIVPKHFGSSGLFSHHLFRVRPLETSPLTNYYLYFLLMTPSVRDQVISCTNGTTVNMLSIDGLKHPKFTLPPEELISRFMQIVSPIFEMMENNFEQSRTLAAIRDTLLPKLISGEIRVPDAMLEAAET